MATTIKLKNGSGAPLAGDLVQGEPALDLTNKRLYTEDSGGTVIEVGTNPTSLTTGTFTSTGIDDNATSTAITIDSSQDVTFTGSLSSQGLTVGDTSSSFSAIFITSSTTGESELRMGDTDTDAGSIAYTNSDDTMTFRTAAGPKMTIDSSGKVGIGTSSPSSYNGAGDDLVVAGSGNTGMSIVSGSSSAGTIYFADGTSGSETYRSFIEYTHSDDALKFGTSGTERMRIDSSGNVILNQSAGAADNTILRITGGTAGFSTLHLADTADINIGYVQYDHTNNALTFASNNAERMRIDSSGNVGIGTTSPSFLIEAYGATNASTGWNAGGTVTGFAQANTSNGDFRFGTTTSHAVGFYISGTERMRIDASGNLLVGTTSLSGHFTNGLPTATLSTGSTGGTTFTRTHRASASNNATVDAFRFLDANGNVNNGYINGHLYVTVVGSSGLYSSTRMYYIQTNSNSTSNANFTLLSTAARGVDPVSSIAMVADGGSGAVKIQVTYINNSVVVTGGTSTISFIGQA